MQLCDTELLSGSTVLESEEGRAEFHREAIQLLEDVESFADHLSFVKSDSRLLGTAEVTENYKEYASCSKAHHPWEPEAASQGKCSRPHSPSHQQQPCEQDGSIEVCTAIQHNGHSAADTAPASRTVKAAPVASNRPCGRAVLLVQEQQQQQQQAVMAASQQNCKHQLFCSSRRQSAAEIKDLEVICSDDEDERMHASERCSDIPDELFSTWSTDAKAQVFPTSTHTVMLRTAPNILSAAGSPHFSRRSHSATGTPAAGGGPSHLQPGGPDLRTMMPTCPASRCPSGSCSPSMSRRNSSRAQRVESSRASFPSAAASAYAGLHPAAADFRNRAASTRTTGSFILRSSASYTVSAWPANAPPGGVTSGSETPGSGPEEHAGCSSRGKDRRSKAAQKVIKKFMAKLFSRKEVHPDIGRQPATPSSVAAGGAENGEAASEAPSSHSRQCTSDVHLGPCLISTDSASGDGSAIRGSPGSSSTAAGSRGAPRTTTRKGPTDCKGLLAGGISESPVEAFTSPA